MRLIRLSLKNYRGIDESEVLFNHQGLTVVQGPNEAGKTSLCEAIRLLFEYPDDSNHKKIKAIKPVTKDVGPEIELEAESGSYVFTYFKKFGKDPATILTITKPKSENLTERNAHNRAQKILRETIDIDLWKALCIQQGAAIKQADLSKHKSLSAALDIAAGGQRDDPQEESLFDKVEGEYELYFTKGRGDEKPEWQKGQKDEEAERAKVDSLEMKIQSLEENIKRAKTLGLEVKRLEKQEKDFQGRVLEHTESLKKINELETALKTAKLELEVAQKDKDAAERNKEERQALIDKISEAEKEHEKLKESNKSLIKSSQDAENHFTDAQLGENKAETVRKNTESLLNLRQADVDYFNNKLHLEQLKERKTHIDNARDEADRADESLQMNSVDEGTLKIIKEAERSLIEAQAKLDMGAPEVRLTGLATCDFQINGEQKTISKDEELRLPIPDRVQVTIPGALQMEVTARSSSSDLSTEFAHAQKEFDALCKKAGVNDAEEAQQSFGKRQNAQASKERQKGIKKENLRDLTYEELEKKVRVLNKSVPAYIPDRNQEPKLPEDQDAANMELQSAKDAFEKANTIWEEARKKLDQARSVHGNLNNTSLAESVNLEVTARDLTRSNIELVQSRESTSDDKLETEHSKYTNLVDTEEKKVKSAETALSDKNPYQVKALEETAKGSLKTTQDQLADTKGKNSDAKSFLKIHGEKGLHEELDTAQSRLGQIMKQNAAWDQRAQATKLLYETMKTERDNARRAYVAPLKEKIERLGRLVFSNSFEVNVQEEDLSVSSRTMDGSTIPFNSLSGGTKEQISLISRLACAMIVSKDGGAYLILDDALGYTDPERLKLMGAVLAKAGKECQIIILTCVPDRYNNVGEAKMVRLGWS